MHAAPTQPEPTFPKIFYLVTPILACLLMLGLLELLLALFWPVPFVAEHNMYYMVDPHTGYRLQPNSRGRFRRGGYGEVNSHGHRDDEGPLTKPPGTLRILVLGDSFTQGSNVGQQETYAQVLERLLQERLKASWDVINTGVGGWHPFQYAEYYEHYGQDFEPDLVLVGFFVGNDTFSGVRTLEETRTAIDGRRLTRKIAARKTTKAKVRLYSHSHLARLFLNRGRFLLTREELMSDIPEPRDGGRFPEKYLMIQGRRLRSVHRALSPAVRQGIRNSIAQIVRIQTLAAEYSIPVAVLLIPDENQVNPTLARQVLPVGEELSQYDLEMPQKLLRPLFAARGMTVIDPLPDFLADDRRLYMNDAHWNPEGHRLAAERILDELLPLILKAAQST